MFFTVSTILVVTSLAIVTQLTAEERRGLTATERSQSLRNLNTAILFYFINLVVVVKVATVSLVDRTVPHVETTVPLLNYLFLKGSEPKITAASSGIAVFLLVGGLNVPKVLKFTSLESIYILLGSIISSAAGWRKRTADSLNLYDYFAVGLVGLTVGSYIVSILPWKYGLEIYQADVKTSTTGTLTVVYYNLKLFLSPVYLTKYVPLTTVGNNTAIYVTLVTMTSATTLTLPLLAGLSDLTSNIKLTGLFLMTASLLTVYSKFQTLKDIVLLSSPTVSVPLLGTLSST